jgi:uncharacterized protein (TIGR03083 family)
MALPLDVYLSHLRADGAAMAGAAGRDLTAAVPGCPEWTTTDVLQHLGQVHRWTEHIVRTNADRPVSRSTTPPPPEGTELVEWFATGVEQLAAALEAADPKGFAWNWSGEDQTISWWPRRMSQETAVHRWDVEQAVGDTPAPIDSAMGVDGVDELFDVILPRRPDNGPFTPDGATVHLHATDAEGEWLLRFAGTTVQVSHGHAKGDAALRGPAGDLLLFLWKRLPADAPGFEVFGNALVLDNWVEQTRL